MIDEHMADDFLGRCLNEYRLDALLGQGGMGRVYRAFDIRLKRWAAVKLIGASFQADPDYISRFEREAQAVAQLKHPHIIGVYRYGEVDDLFYIAMEYIEGTDLESFLATSQAGRNAISSEKISRLVRQICLALDYAHSQGIVHRDVKPSNILIDQKENAILTDFGLVLWDNYQTRGEILGTPSYIAPEQVISSAGAVPQSDLYAVGVILYEMFTAKLPFQATHPHDVAMLHLAEPPVPPHELNPDISPDLEAVILRSLAKEPEERYPTGLALADALDQALKPVFQSAQKSLSEHRSVVLSIHQSAKEGKLMAPRYLLKNIQLLLAELTDIFTEEELRRLCLDLSDFQPVHHQVRQSNSKAEIVKRLLEYAEQTLQLDELLALAKAHSPAIYEKHKPYYEFISTSSKGLIGKSLGKYHIIELLGQGGMADVYKAYQSGLARYVAVKIIHSHLIDNEELVERFESEALAVADLRHPNIVQIFDFDRDEDHYYMVMEFVDGPTLATELKNRKAENQLFSWKELIEIFNGLTDAIDYAHSRGVIHRDLKPGNIMFSSRRRVVLTDFGIARIASVPSYTVTNAVLGTPFYMSPEQARGEEVGKRTDIYSLGVILYQLVTGRTPFEGDNSWIVIMNLINGSYPLPTTINPDLPVALEQVILRAMSNDPQDRYQTGRELAHALQAAVESTDNPLSLIHRPEPTSLEQLNQIIQSPNWEGSALGRPDADQPAEMKSLQKSPAPEIKIPSTSGGDVAAEPDQPEKSGSVITISGNSGQLVIGGHNVQLGDVSGGQIFTGKSLPPAQPQTEGRQANLVVLRQLVADLEVKIAAEAAPDKREAALERLAELAEALTAPTPDLDTIAYVKGWFAKNFPTLAEPITVLINHPITARLIAAAGDVPAAEFYRRFQAT